MHSSVSRERSILLDHETAIRQAGEWIAAAALIELGVQVMVSLTTGCDLLAYSGKRFWRVEVKSTIKPETDKKEYRINRTCGSAKKSAIDSDCDIVALVSIQKRRVFFRQINSIKAKSAKLSMNHFVEGCGKHSWEEATGWK